MTTNHKTAGQAPRFAAWLSAVLTTVLAAALTSTAWAVTLDEVSFSKLPGDRVQIKLELSDAVDEPLSLKHRLGEPLMSRLYEMCEVVPMRGRDYRIWVSQHSRYG